MDKNLLQKLKDWRVKTARRENVELFRVISNQALEEIAEKKPQSKAELLEVKGIKEKKYAKYGEEILAMVQGENLTPNPLLVKEREQEENKIFEVGEYLDFLNEKLSETEARIRGEASGVEFRIGSIYFSIKDKKQKALINCYMREMDYKIGGVELQEGMEVILDGNSRIYESYGKLTFQTRTIEPVGEGALKKAYDELKRKFEEEGLFAEERKRTPPMFPQNIGLITSKQGAAIDDFKFNLGNFGFKIKFYDSRVEGKQAVFDLLEGINWFNKNFSDADMLVIIRGGGSLESLQAFNNEALVREIANSKIPVLCGVGHEKDESLAALVADRMVSTPSMAAAEINKSWDEAIYKIEQNEKAILNNFEKSFSKIKNKISASEHVLSRKLSDIFERFRRAREKLKNNLVKIKMTIDYEKNYLSNTSRKLVSSYIRLFSEFKNLLKSLAEKIITHNPERQLKLGYSLVSFNNKIIRSVRDIEIGDEVDIKLSDGELKSKINSVIARERSDRGNLGQSE